MPESPTVNPLLEQVEADLRSEYPRLAIERTEHSLRVPATAESGFAVQLVDAGQEVVPVLGGWVAYGLGAEEAVPLFRAGVTGEARVRETSRAGVTYRWGAEFLRCGTWVRDKHDYYSFPLFPGPLPFFGRKRERVLWNDPNRLIGNDG